MAESSRNAEIPRRESSNESSPDKTDKTAFSRRLYRKSDSHKHKSRRKEVSGRKTYGGDEDFDAHYSPPQYDTDQIAHAQRESQRVFGKTWEEVRPKDIDKAIESLTSQAKRTLSTEKRSDIEIKQYIVGITASQKIDPQSHKEIFGRLDLIAQKLAQE
jgi:hypothetical protein